MAKAKKKAGTKPAGTKRGPRITSIAKKPEEMQRARNHSEQEASAKALLEKLGLYEELSGGEADPEGDVESEASPPEE